MEYKIISFEPKEVPDEFWENYYEFISANSKHDNPNDPLPNLESIIKRQKAEIPHYLVKRWLAITPDEKVIGWAGMGRVRESNSEYEMNKHTCNINIRVLNKYFRKGIGTELLKTIVSEVKKLGCTVMETGTNNDAGRAFLEHYGAQMTIEGSTNRLYLENVDWDLMQQWIESGPIKAKGVKIESFDTVPEEILDEYTEMYTEALNMQPLGETEERANVDGKMMRAYEKRRKETDQTSYTLITREKDGSISGMTEIFYEPREHHRIIQGLTGVRPEFRGRGLGKWLKALMIVHIKENYPEVEFVTTGNAEANAPMLSINDRMGFKQYKSAEGYKFKTEKLVERLGI